MKGLTGVNLKNKMNEIGIMPKAVSIDFLGSCKTSSILMLFLTPGKKF
jgi:hypothetical protein